MSRPGDSVDTDRHVPKPNWMRCPVHDRSLEEILAAQGIVDAHRAIFVEKLTRIMRRSDDIGGTLGAIG